jgi:hypothetical protein
MVFRFFEREQECGVRAATIFEIGERERGIRLNGIKTNCRLSKGGGRVLLGRWFGNAKLCPMKKQSK